MASIYLSIGSNIEPEFYFQQCATALQETFTHPVWSPIYRSAAVGMDGDDFLNAVVQTHTDQSIELTIKLLKQIELDNGREHDTNKFTSRTLDVDLLLYDDVVLDSAILTLPRAELITAAYVLKPLADLSPNGVHPILDKTYTALLSELERDQPESIKSLSLVNLILK